MLDTNQPYPNSVMADLLIDLGVPEELAATLREDKHLFQLPRTNLGLVHAHRLMEDTVAICLGNPTPTGEWSPWQEFGVIETRTCDGVERWLVIRPFTNTKKWWALNPTPRDCKVGDIVTRVVPHHFTERRGPALTAGYDVCRYCGCSNGLHGELRNAGDCGACGSS